MRLSKFVLSLFRYGHKVTNGNACTTSLLTVMVIDSIVRIAETEIATDVIYFVLSNMLI